MPTSSAQDPTASKDGAEGPFCNNLCVDSQNISREIRTGISEDGNWTRIKKKKNLWVTWFDVCISDNRR